MNLPQKLEEFVENSVFPKSFGSATSKNLTFLADSQQLRFFTTTKKLHTKNIFKFQQNCFLGYSNSST